GHEALAADDLAQVPGPTRVRSVDQPLQRGKLLIGLVHGATLTRAADNRATRLARGSTLGRRCALMQSAHRIARTGGDSGTPTSPSTRPPSMRPRRSTPSRG